MRTPLLACLLATSALAASAGVAANTVAASPAPTATKAAVAPAPTPTTNVAMLQIKQSNKFGKYLTDGNGQALYIFGADTRAGDDVKAKSACTGACAVAWPPATIKNMPKAGSGIEASEMSTIARADGTKQLTYDGSPLYLFSHDQSGSAPKGQGINHFGGMWHLVTPGGAIDQKGIG